MSSFKRVITEEYRKLNMDLHAAQPFGGNGRKWSDTIAGLVLLANSPHFKARFGVETILDYGCGEGTMKVHLMERLDQLGMSDIDVREYDPCIPGKDKEPEPADFVVCTDILEHVEPELLFNALNHLDGLINKFAFFVVATQDSVVTLPDGSHAHRIIENGDWWLERLDVMHWSISIVPARKPNKALVFLMAKNEVFKEWLHLSQTGIGKHAIHST